MGVVSASTLGLGGRVGVRPDPVPEVASWNDERVQSSGGSRVQGVGVAPDPLLGTRTSEELRHEDGRRTGVNRKGRDSRGKTGCVSLFNETTLFPSAPGNPRTPLIPRSRSTPPSVVIKVVKLSDSSS